MKKVPLNELFKEAKNYSMTEGEKKTVWNGVLRRASDFPDGVSPYSARKSRWDGVFRRGLSLAPVRIPVLSRLQYGGALPTLKRNVIFSRKKKYVLGLLASSLVLSGGISAFAQDALPGDLLYPVKIHVNENIQTSLAFTPLEKVNVESNLATKRLEEVEKLAVQGKLDPAVERKLGESFTGHVSRFQKNLTDLEATNQVDASVQASAYFTARLAAHTIVLNDLTDKMQSASSTQESSNQTMHMLLSVKGTATSSLNAKGFATSTLDHTATLADAVFDRIVATTTQPVPGMTRKYVRMFNRENVDAVKYLRDLRQNVGLPDVDSDSQITVIGTTTSATKAQRTRTLHRATSTVPSKNETPSEVQVTSGAVTAASTTGGIVETAKDLLNIQNEANPALTMPKNIVP